MHQRHACHYPLVYWIVKVAYYTLLFAVATVHGPLHFTLLCIHTLACELMLLHLHIQLTNEYSPCNQL